MKIHKINGRSFFKDTFCGVAKYPHIKITKDWRKVTCKNCLKCRK